LRSRGTMAGDRQGPPGLPASAGSQQQAGGAPGIRRGSALAHGGLQVVCWASARGASSGASSRPLPNGCTLTGMPPERAIVLHFRDVLLMQALLTERLELLGAEVPPRRVADAREYLLHRTPKELRGLFDKLADAQVSWDEPTA